MSRKAVITVIKPVIRKPLEKSRGLTIRELVNERPASPRLKNPMHGIENLVNEELKEYPFSDRTLSAPKNSNTVPKQPKITKTERLNLILVEI